MEKIKQALQHSAKILKDDVDMFRQIILKSGGGNLPTDIIEKHAFKRD
ncbi:MAG: hypothetical protein ACKO13_13820 [Cytophagales bacterium]